MEGLSHEHLTFNDVIVILVFFFSGSPCAGCQLLFCRWHRFVLCFHFHHLFQRLCILLLCRYISPLKKRKKNNNWSFHFKYKERKGKESAESQQTCHSTILLCGEIGRPLVKAPLAAAISQYLISLTTPVPCRR